MVSDLLGEHATGLLPKHATGFNPNQHATGFRPDLLPDYPFNL